MIRSEKKWTSKDFEENIKNFKLKKATFTRSTMAGKTPSKEDPGQSAIGDLFHLGESSEEESMQEEFEAKRVKDAENKIIEKIFGGKEEDLNFKMFINESSLISGELRKFDKTCQTDVEQRTHGTQTSISLVSPRFDDLFRHNQLEDLLREFEFKKNLMLDLNPKDLFEGDLEDEAHTLKVFSKIKAAIDQRSSSPDSLLPARPRQTLLKRGFSDYLGQQSPKAPDFGRPDQSRLEDSSPQLLQPHAMTEGENAIVYSTAHLPQVSLQDLDAGLGTVDGKQDKNNSFYIPLGEDLLLSKTITEKQENLRDLIHSIRDAPDDAGQKDEQPSLKKPKPERPKISVVVHPPDAVARVPASESASQANNSKSLHLKVLNTQDEQKLFESSLPTPKKSDFSSQFEGVDEMTHQNLSPKSSKNFWADNLSSKSERLSPLAQKRQSDSEARAASVAAESNHKQVMVGMLQQLTYEINKNAVLDSKLDKISSKLKDKDAEMKHVKDELLSLHSQFLKVEKQMKELAAENERLREGLSVIEDRSEAEEEDLDAPETGKKSDREKPKTKRPKKKPVQDKKKNELINQKISNLHKGLASLKLGYQNTNAKELISLLNKGQFARFKNPMSLKAIMRTINTLFTDRTKEINTKPETRNIAFADYVYSYYMQVFGIQAIAEKKFTFFVLSLKYFAAYFRVNLFSRFMGLVEQHKYEEDIITKYFEGVDFMENYCQKGFPIKNADSAVRVLQPFIRADEYARFLFEEKLLVKELVEYRKSLEKLKEPDPTGMNSGVVDVDLFMEKIMEKYSLIVNRTKQYVIDAFKACDLDGNNCISVNEFVLLNRFIEPKTFDLNTCVSWFFENVDSITEKEQNMSFDKFAVVCTNLNLFSEKSQHTFLGISSNEEVKSLFMELKKAWPDKYHHLLDTLNSFELLTPEEMEDWRNILLLLNDRMTTERPATELKPSVMAYLITKNEFDRIKQEDEQEVDRDENDLSKMVSLKKDTANEKSAIDKQDPQGQSLLNISPFRR